MQGPVRIASRSPALAFTLFWAAAVLAGCGDDGSGPTPPPEDGLVVEPRTVTLESGEKETFRLLRFDSGVVVDTVPAIWWSNDTAVARVNVVSEGAFLTARGPGTARVHAVPEEGDQTLAVGEVTVTPLRFVQVSAGELHTCGVTETNRAFCWGSRRFGILGDGGAEDQHAPTPVAGGLDFRAVSANYRHTCGLTVEGEAYCWGLDGGVGRLGDGTLSGAATVPRRVEASDLRFASISAGAWFTCALTSEGRAHCWGENEWGSLGVGSGTDSPVPVAVAGGVTFASVAAGARHACGVTSGGTGYCWGRNAYGGGAQAGQLGDGTSTDRFVPTPVAGGHRWRAISPGVGHTCGVTTGGVAYCWGFNVEGSLGLGTMEPTSYLTPTRVDTDLRFEEVRAGLVHTCGRTTDGLAYCWGYNGETQLGRAYQEVRRSDVPVSVTGGDAFRWIADIGGTHTCGLADDDLLYCWGGNFYGMLGIGDNAYNGPEPVPVLWQR